MILLILILTLEIKTLLYQKDMYVDGITRNPFKVDVEDQL